jgi:uncharacterized RDD family membrane protein YckC
MIDSVIVNVPIFILDRLVFSSYRTLTIYIAWLIIRNFAYTIYSITLHARWGQTLGKKAVGVVVLSNSEKSIPSFRQAILRDLDVLILGFISFSISLYPVLSSTSYSQLAGEIYRYGAFGWTIMSISILLFNYKHRALHDYIAGTVVIRKDTFWKATTANQE